MNLYVDCCPRKESRTRRLARAVLDQLGSYTELDLYKESIAPIDGELVEKRLELIEKRAFDDEMFRYARQFAEADVIVIAAPYWDGSFPSLLKIYIENVYAVNIVAKYEADGRPVGLCKARKLYYVTTAGGPLDERFGFDYIKMLATECFGIREAVLVKADMLDIVGYDAELRLSEAAASVKL